MGTAHILMGTVRIAHILMGTVRIAHILMGTVRIAHIMCLCVQVATQAVVKVMQEKPACSNSDIESQLLEAAKNGDIDVVKVSYGSSLSLTPLSSPLSYLLPISSVLQRLCTPKNVNCRDMQGRFSTPLHFAAGYNRVETVEFLLKNKADVNAKDKGYSRITTQNT